MQIHSEGSRTADLKRIRIQDLTLFDFGKLATATNNFHSENKLGQGGFAPVYKVILIYQSSSYFSSHKHLKFLLFNFPG